MRVTRKSLEASNTELRAKLAVHDHTTRKALNEYVRATKAENKTLKEQAKALAEKVESLAAELALAKAETVNA